jgi:hypothetical protein
LKDFDAFIKERNKKNKKGFRAFGKTYTLPASIPYDAMLRIRALSKNTNKEIGEEEVFTLFESLVGRATIDELRTHAEFDMDFMTELMKYTLEQYGMTNEKKIAAEVEGQEVAI